MADWRRYTGTKTLQTGWTLAVLGLAAVVEFALSTGIPAQVTLGVAGLAWILGLALLGLQDRRAWNRMVEESAFESDPGAHTADLQKIIQGQSVTVSTDVSGILAQAHTHVRATIDGVDASFQIRIRDEPSAKAERGLTTGNDAIDERFVIDGSPENVKALLSPDVQAALMGVETPGTITVTADHVVYDIPYTRLTASELDAAGQAVGMMADRIESVGQG